MNKLLPITITLIVGCVAGATASHVVSPAARAGTPPTKWEYKCPENATVARLNELGAQGWELVSVVGTPGDVSYSGIRLQYCLKRPY
jgi:hypothetical protein